MDPNTVWRLKDTSICIYTRCIILGVSHPAVAACPQESPHLYMYICICISIYVYPYICISVYVYLYMYILGVWQPAVAPSEARGTTLDTLAKP